MTVLIGLAIVSCSQETTPDSFESLQDYIDSEKAPPIENDLIACAGGREGGLLGSGEPSISVFFYPEGNATDFRYYETDSIELDPDDLTNYRSRELPLSPVFNGYLQRFLRDDPDRPIWCRVSFVKDGDIHISNAIHLKLPDLPSEINNDLLTVDQSDPLSPVFDWRVGLIDDNVIYFQVVSDSENNLISGTYTIEEQFRFYELSNVVLNIRDVNPAPMLESNAQYSYTLMGISLDNWVNLLITADFNTAP